MSQKPLTGHVEEADVEHLTDAELAMQVYLAIIGPDDALPDSTMEMFRPAWTMAAILRQRLVGPYCEVEGCQVPHLRSFPWCHLNGHEEIVQQQRAAAREAHE